MNYRIDHLAFRTLDRSNCVKFFCEALGYKEVTKFEIDFNDDGTDLALCSVLEPIDRLSNNIPWIYTVPASILGLVDGQQPYNLAPEIFVSEGTPGSIVHNWASKRDGGGLHHIALQVPEDSTVEKEMAKWKEKQWCEDFTSQSPFVCDEMSQIFTKPSKYTGVIFEIIKRKEAGFCKASVKSLMQSTKGD